MVDISILKYQGAFRLPAGDYGDSNANYSRGAIAYNADNHSLFVAGHVYHGAVAEFEIPEIVKSSTLSELKTASTVLQPFAKATNRAPVDAGLGIHISGIYYHQNKLLVNVYRFYDHGPEFFNTPSLIFENASDLKNSEVYGYLKVENGVRAAGWVAPVPREWQSRLGGSHIGGFTSSTDRANVYSASVGPAAYSMNLSAVFKHPDTAEIINSNALVSYRLYDLGDDDWMYNHKGDNQLWTHYSEGSFGMIIPGSRTYMVLGKSGGHKLNVDPGNESKPGMSYGVPPYDGDKGHYTLSQYDKYSYYWLYDVLDLEKVKKGQAKPKELKPYAMGIFNHPFSSESSFFPIGGGSFDANNGILYLTVREGDREGGGTTPVIIAYKFDTSAPISRMLAPAIKVEH